MINRKLVETPVRMMNRMEEITDLICEYNEEVQKQQQEIERLNNIIKQYDKVSFIHEMELQKRIDKAIELVKQRIKEVKNEELSYVEMTSKDYIVEQEELLQILNKGESND